ncbi:class II fructose-bisphosphate aldolase family protein [Patescibacteria group bacterium]|nr:class II fructose-bisphosphate aldolase family protein [Patescibacteria group bacterium]
MLVDLKKLVQHAQKNNYCLGAFNIHNIESIKGIVEAASKLKSPAIIQASESSVKYFGVKSIVCLVNEIILTYGASIPFTLHLDHGNDIDLIKACINSGFKSVHIDASAYPLKENIKITKKIVNYAKGKNVWVQGEVGMIMGSHGKVSKKIGVVPLANCEDVVRFAKETNVNTVAAAIGTAHGSFDDEKVSFDLLKAIKKDLRIPFVMHGGSGVPDRDIRKAIKMGVNIINVGTDIKVAFTQSVIKASLKNSKETDPRILFASAKDDIKKVVEKKMKLFASSGQF